jgi:hypothetical protein
VKSTVGLLCPGKSNFEAIEPLRNDRFFKEALRLLKIPCSVGMRQCVDGKAGGIGAR